MYVAGDLEMNSMGAKAGAEGKFDWLRLDNTPTHETPSLAAFTSKQFRAMSDLTPSVILVST